MVLKKVFLGTCFFASSILAQDMFITVDQFGYRTNAKKIAVLRDPVIGADSLLSYTPSDKIQVVDSATGNVILEKTPVAFLDGQIDEASGDRIWWLDFSELNIPGTYFIRDAADLSKESFYFRIRDDIYNDILKAALRMLFYQRVGHAKDAAYAGENWADGASHLQDKEATLYSKKGDASTKRDVSGGWYDAGDFNKYTAWTGNYIEALVKAYMERPLAFTDDYGIPESGNGIPDIIDEIHWGLEHLLRLQNPDGSVLSVVGESHKSPPSSATEPTYYGPANTIATWSAAKAFALASILETKRNNKTFADSLKNAALKAYAWAETYPDSMFYNNDETRQPGSGGLAAGQQETEEDPATGQRIQNKMACEFALYELTGDKSYLKTFEENYLDLPLFAWGDGIDQYRHTQHQLYISYIGYKDANASIKQEISDKLITVFRTKTNDYAQMLEKDGYRAHLRDYNWGSNSAKAANGFFYYSLAASGLAQSDSSTYVDAAEEYLHYIHGVNPLALVYLSNMQSYGASKSVVKIYHGWFQPGTKWYGLSETNVGPAPGYLAGGPNSRYTWDACCEAYNNDNSVKGCGSTSNNQLCYAESVPKSLPPEKFYKDFGTGWPLNSWELSEPSVGYQINYIRLISKFVLERGTESTPIKKAGTPKIQNIQAKFKGNRLEISGESNVEKVSVYDLKNRAVFKETLNTTSGTVQFDLNLNAGVYFIRIKTNKGLTTLPVLKIE